MNGAEFDSILGPRWKELPNDGALDPRVQQAQQLLAQIASPTLLSPSVRLRVAARVRATNFHKRKQYRFAWLALASLGLAGAAVGGGLRWVWLQSDKEIVLEAPRSAMHASAAASNLAALVTSDQAAATPSLETLPPLVEDKPVPLIRAPSPKAKVQPQPQAAATPESSLLAEESRLLAAALAHLRNDRDGEKALAALQAYEQRFPRGQLVPEVNRVRVEALLGTRQDAAALHLLDGLRFSASARDTEMLVLRGELRAQTQRCAEAQTDFSSALARVQTGAAAERALYGRASCHQSQGERDAAKLDLQLYLQRFPHGRFAAAVRRALASG